jgi:hypothetical protein
VNRPVKFYCVSLNEHQTISNIMEQTKDTRQAITNLHDDLRRLPCKSKYVTTDDNDDMLIVNRIVPELIEDMFINADQSSKFHSQCTSLKHCLIAMFIGQCRSEHIVNDLMHETMEEMQP